MPTLSSPQLSRTYNACVILGQLKILVLAIIILITTAQVLAEMSIVCYFVSLMARQLKETYHRGVVYLVWLFFHHIGLGAQLEC